MKSLIYHKLFKISPATNKSFSQGEIVNFLEVDAERLPDLSYYLPSIFRFPVLLVACSYFLFYFLGYSFLSGIGVFIIAFFTNFGLGALESLFWKKTMKAKDQRMNVTTESINNIKMLKLYSWDSTF